jgi:cytochrome b
MTSEFKWDWVVKATHWTVAGLFFTNFFITSPGSDTHEMAGYIVIAAIVIRLLWGLITHSPARLSRFAPSIPSAIEHLKEVLHERKDNHKGHNPAGAIMIWVMWPLILGTAISGWSMETDMFWGVGWVKEIHETLASLTMLAVTIHVSAIIVMTKLVKKNYLKSMLP